jgi:hypothetical protein
MSNNWFLAKDIIDVGLLGHNAKKLTHDCDLFRSFHSTKHLWSTTSSAIISSGYLSTLIHSHDLS